MSYTAAFSPYARKYIRERASDLLTDTCKIHRQRGYTLNSENEHVPNTQLVYEGPCRLWELNTGMSVQIGEENVAVTQTVISLPWAMDPLPQLEDLVEMTGSEDVVIEGKMFRIGEPAKGGNLRATRRYQVSTTDGTE